MSRVQSAGTPIKDLGRRVAGTCHQDREAFVEAVLVYAYRAG